MDASALTPPGSTLSAASVNACPEWCEREHLGQIDDPCGFHHDGPVSTISLVNQVVPGVFVDLFVNVSEHTHHGDPVERPLVEIQDDHNTLALLTPDEAVSLAEALIGAAAVVTQSARHRSEVWAVSNQRAREHGARTAAPNIREGTHRTADPSATPEVEGVADPEADSWAQQA
jgi:hypothetical protein